DASTSWTSCINVNAEGLLKKGQHVVGDHSIRLACMIRQIRHEHHAGCLLHRQSMLDDVVTINPRIPILRGGKLKDRLEAA
ncbi:MAG: hypothetical protein ABIU05_18475, partial [Nitrospirales bacterium]